MLIRKSLSLVALTALTFLSACTEKGPVEPGSPSVVGTWMLETMNGQDATAFDASWTFQQNGQATFNQGALGCSTTLTYTLASSKILTTVVDDGCDEAQPGEKDTTAYTIAGDRMTLKRDGDTYIFKKVTQTAPSLIGIWNVLTVDGQGPANGMTMKLRFTATVMNVEKSQNGESCNTLFNYTKNSNTLNIAVTSDDCSGLEPGATDVVTTTIANNRLTLVFSDGTTIVAQK